MINYEDIEKLLEYAEIEGNELGEACELLCKIIRFNGYLSDKFIKAAEEEFYKQLNNFITNAEISKKEITRTIIENIVELKWKNN